MLPSSFEPDCPHPAVRVDRLEAFVIDTLRSHLTQTKAADRIKDAIRRAKTRMAKQTTSDERKLVAVRQKIERGTENLALADRENFTPISKLLAKWREEESAIVERIERSTGALEPLPEALDGIERLGDLADQLRQADRVKLAHAMPVSPLASSEMSRNEFNRLLTENFPRFSRHGYPWFPIPLSIRIRMTIRLAWRQQTTPTWERQGKSDG